MRISLVAWSFALLSVAPAAAFIPSTIEMRCPVGGERFEAEGFASYSTYGSRPDGKTYTNWVSPRPMPECPRNRLVVYKEFSEEEVSRLRDLIAGDAYRAMSGVETPYYRAAWLARQLDAQSPDIVPLLLQATWEAGDGTERRARYLRDFAAAVEAAPVVAGDIGSLSWRARAVNARRELGEFSIAIANLDAIPINGLDAPIPEEQRTPLSGGGMQIENSDEIQAARARHGLLSYLQVMRRLIERQDSSVEPIDAIPSREAASRCMETDLTTAPAITQETCASPDVQRWVSTFTRFRNQ